MKTELFAAAGLTALFALSNAADKIMPPRMTAEEKQQALILKTCEQVNYKFMGDRDVYAKARVKGCQTVINVMNALIAK